MAQRQRKATKGIYHKDIDTIDKYLSWGIVLMVLLLPLILHAKSGVFISPSLQSGVESGLKGEIYNGYKSNFLVMMASVLMLLLAIKVLIYRYPLKKTILNPLLILLAVGLLVSLVFAEYKSVALYGYFSRREGTLTWLCYLAIFFVSINTHFPARMIKWLINGLAIMTGINLIIGLSAFAGHNLLDWPLLRNLIIPPGMPFEAGGIIRSTLANPNYVSGLFAALTLFFLLLAVYEPDRKRRIFLLTCSAAAFVLVLTALSSSGFMALIITLPLALYLILFRGSSRTTLITIGIMAASLTVLWFYFNTYQPLILVEAWQRPLAEIQAVKEYTANPPAWEPDPDNPLSLPPSGSAPLSGRLYIWQETLQLIKEKPLTGYGLDTLVFYFPQNDPLKRLHLFAYDRVLDKPHNFFLEIAYGSGIPALIIFMCIQAIVFIRVWTCFRQNNKPEGANIAFLPAYLVFLIAFLLQGLVNDSVIGSSVIFWVLSGIAVNIVYSTTETAKA